MLHVITADDVQAKKKELEDMAAELEIMGYTDAANETQEIVDLIVALETLAESKILRLCRVWDQAEREINQKGNTLRQAIADYRKLE